MGEIIRRDITDRDISHLNIDWDKALELAERNIPDDDSPELTDDLLTRARPSAEVLREHFGPDIAEALLKRPGRPKSATPKETVTIRLSPHVVRFFKEGGSGWQTRINQVLDDFVARQQ